MPIGHYPRPSLAQRLWERVDKGDGCWDWTARVNENGYGVIAASYRKRYAHRASWELTYGPIPDGLCVLHRCDNRRCVRPDHLFLGTRQDNSADMVAKGRSTRRTHCIRGHLLEGNRWFHRGQPNKSECAICRRARIRRSNAA